MSFYDVETDDISRAAAAFFFKYIYTCAYASIK